MNATAQPGYTDHDAAPLGDPFDEAWLENLATVDYRNLRDYREGRFVGFCIGVLSVLAGLMVLSVIDWIVAS